MDVGIGDQLTFGMLARGVGHRRHRLFMIMGVSARRLDGYPPRL